ncbi:MAG TPA: cytochrome c oxidase subunit 3 [Acidimicrobiales bacterium]|jgi:heme/copper-type cytochrome/quinol oxidase subunit 3
MTATAPAVALSSPVPGRGRSIAWWGIVLVIATEATIFFALLSAYFFIRAGSPTWPQGHLEKPALGHISVFTVVLLASSAPLFWGERAIRRGDLGRLRIALAVSFVLGLAFLANQVKDYQDLTFGARDNAYASLFYLITGLHGLHVLVGLCMNGVVQAKAWTRRVSAEHHIVVTVFSLYWHFVDVVWIFVFSSLFLSVSLR